MRRKHTKTGQKRPRAKAPSPKPIGIVVRRGALRRFDALTRKTAGLPVVVSWDRRQVDGRASSERSQPTDQQKTERRQKPPFTWEVAEFVVLDRAPHNSARRGMAKATKERTLARRARNVALSHK